MTEAQYLVEQGRALDDHGDLTGAEAAYCRAADLSPEWSVPYYNLGLLCKYQGLWSESLDFNRRAAALSPDDEAAWWNLGIAATAVEDWAEARRAWRACGMEPPAGSGPPDFKFGLTPIRLDPVADLAFRESWPPVNSDCEGDPRDCIAYVVRENAAAVDWKKVPRDSASIIRARIENAPFDTTEVLAIANDIRQNTPRYLTFSYGYETTVSYAWSPRGQCFVLVFACC